VLNNLGLAQLWLGRYPEAQRTLERALAVALKTRGPDHPQATFALGRLGDLHTRMGDLRAAETYYGRALAGNRTLRETESMDLVPNLRGWGRLLTRRGRLQEAEAALDRALGLAEGSDASSIEIAPTLTALAELRLRQGRPEDARRALDRALDLVRRDRFTQMEALVLLGDANAAVGARADAESAYRRARAVAEELYAPGHPERRRAARALDAFLARS
jgi:tetratricopeptide (TPR) repeat protein